ncbi:MAG: histidine phosphatase family protein [Gammaproteobacteria bacterium]|uniref:histidine phosphatase family protein n=1 Tax=Pseudomaricurvus alcaniphilus TaxID=1166482 RepID=UPI00140C2320|nr:histidine phosphatase family protein [Pseudomaricurvus alcaniphilus]MBR9911108.1 histidine phosphatase family protein [Gammaproteobacteria bacterium]NHN36388.1 histidine phosphatase family protein [Pseudomaricurvus alcaniphilus]
MESTFRSGLGNHYCALRHGQSEANTAGVIVSKPARGVAAFGLSEEGRRQVQASAAAARLPRQQVQVHSSDFLRARQTAELLAEYWQLQRPVQYTELLRERDFGELDGAADSNYARVWALDADNADHKTFGVESVNQVRQRALQLLAQIEQQCSGQTIILVAHGDLLQILQTWFAGQPAARHRSLPHLGTAELRPLNPR